MVLLVVTGGCTWVIRPPADNFEARRIVETAAVHNAGLGNFKGLAQVTVSSGRRNTKGRIAFAAAMPDRIRVEWLSAIGQPLTSFAGNGDTITIASRGTGKFYKMRQSNTALDRFVHIPISVEALLNFLVGRPDVPAYAAAQLQPAGDAVQVALKNRWHGLVAVMDIEPQRGHVTRLVRYDGAGSWQYEVRFRNWKRYGGYRVPYQFEIAAPDGQRLILDMDKFWPDVDIRPEMFILTP